MFKSAIDTAIKLKLQGIQVKDPNTGLLVDVPVNFQSDKEMADRMMYPVISIAFVTAEESVEREDHDWRGILADENTKFSQRPMAKGFDLIYQINTFSRYIGQDGVLFDEIAYRFPVQGYLDLIIGDNVTGNKESVWCFQEDFRNLDDIKEMKVYHKAFTYRVLTGQDRLTGQTTIPKADKVITTITQKP